MKLKSIYAYQAGPLGNKWSVNLVDDWTDEIYEKILFTGPNGSGKSSLLRSIGKLWEATAHWLEKGEVLPNQSSAKEWLQRWGGFAVILENVLPEMPEHIGLVYGDASWYDELRKEHSNIPWFGETFSSANEQFKKAKSTLLLPQNPKWVEKWADELRKMILLSDDSTRTPNMIYLDAEERKWISPRKHVGRTTPDNPRSRWLTTYQVTDEWQGQLESSLINVKIIDPQKYISIIEALNEFLFDKQIDPTIYPSDKNRLGVILKNQPNERHRLDILGSGEHQILIMVYSLSRWLAPGGIVLIDEPELHLHPSAFQRLLATFETIVSKRQGQLIITSHSPLIWERYETIGTRIPLGEEQ